MMDRRSRMGIAFACALFTAVSFPVHAADDEEQGGGGTKKTVAMSQQVFEKLQEAQQLIEAKSYGDGHKILRELGAKPKLSTYETAQIWNLSGYAYYLQERYPDSIKSYEKVIAQKDIPEAIIQKWTLIMTVI